MTLKNTQQKNIVVLGYIFLGIFVTTWFAIWPILLRIAQDSSNSANVVYPGTSPEQLAAVQKIDSIMQPVLVVLFCLSLLTFIYAAVKYKKNTKPLEVGFIVLTLLLAIPLVGFLFDWLSQ
jgi:DMSO reductase anchor subunit